MTTLPYLTVTLVLPVPKRPWQHVTMDFQSFPKDKNGYDLILVVVDWLSKRPYSIPCHKTVTAKDMAEMYIWDIYQTHGPPNTITLDHGPQFISEFWHEFCRVLGIKLKLSTAHHPQTDGQAKIVNQHIAQRLRPFVNHYQDNCITDWVRLVRRDQETQQQARH